jgi:hypothetical protein
MDQVQNTHETVAITKHGKAVAKLVPIPKDTDEIYNFLASKGAIVGDVVSPAFRQRVGPPEIILIDARHPESEKTVGFQLQLIVNWRIVHA